MDSSVLKWRGKTRWGPPFDSVKFSGIIWVLHSWKCFIRCLNINWIIVQVQPLPFVLCSQMMLPWAWCISPPGHLLFWDVEDGCCYRLIVMLTQTEWFKLLEHLYQPENERIQKETLACTQTSLLKKVNFTCLGQEEKAKTQQPSTASERLSTS